MVEEDTGGCRGALRALSPKAAAVAVKPAVRARSTGSCAAQVPATIERYLRLFDKLYGHSPLGAPVQVQSSAKP